MNSILIVDDEEDMRHLIDLYVSNAGYSTLQAENGKEALQLIEQFSIKLVLLDIMMPVMDGFQTCEKLREKSDIPVIFLSAKGEEWDKVKGLKIGGDDYLLKPFSPGELIARIEAVLRRVSKDNHISESYTKGKIKIEPASRKVLVNNQTVSLTFKEFELLWLLFNNEERGFTRDQLLEHVWGYDYKGSTRTVDTHIKTLRMKLGTSAGEYVQTIWGLGYKFGVKV
ncbi:response regulator transcription factor [Bacillus spongiae]|uniref:Response regulator transcription factor n=1 Tax=Bacillus spongiae TaxID=2683610 RepID=A0ABU8HBG2_9BACI